MAYNYKYLTAIFVGHGRSTDGSWDPGCTYNGWTEADRALLITQSCVTWARASGIPVITDAFDKNNINMIKQVALSNKKKVKAHIAVHLDYKGASSGVMMCVYPGSTVGKHLAQCLLNAVTKDIGIKSKGISLRKDLYELSRTNMPATIVECGSIKNDIKKFDTAAECEAYGKSLAKGLCEHYGIPFKGEKKKPKYPTNKYAKDIKTYLKKLGYFDGAINSSVTPAYTKAVIEVQNKYFKRKQDRDGLGGSDTLILVKTLYNFRGIKNFKPEEFRCNCGHCTGYPAVVSRRLLLNLQDLRNKNGAISVSSGLRCVWKNNRLVGSSKTSDHLKGRAADFYNSKLTGTKARRSKFHILWKQYKGASYSYSETPNMGEYVHISTKE